jgi:hypothetical protein
MLPPGEYDVFVEEIGLQPEELRRVPVTPGQTIELEVTLQPAVLPVNDVVESSFADPIEDSWAGESQYYSSFELRELPKQRREFSELGRFSSVSNARLATQGLPGWLTGLAADGMLYSPTRHPHLPTSSTRTEVLPLSNFASAELLMNPIDVEWSEFAGAYLTGSTLRGSREPEVRFFGDWTGGVITQSDNFDGQDVGTHSFRAGASVAGPILKDTAHYAIGFEAQRLQTPLPPAWAIDTFDDRLIAVADSYGVNLRPYTRARVVEEELGTAYGRFDWQITENHALSVRGNVSSVKIGGNPDLDPGLGPEEIASIGSEVEGIDLSTSGTLSSRFNNMFRQELRLGIDRTEREYTGTEVLGTRIVEGGLAFGTDPTVPGKFDQLTARLFWTLHAKVSRHRLKFGAGATYLSAEQRYTYATGGEFAFSGVDEFSAASGSFAKAGGTAPFGKYANWQFATYLQDLWQAAPGLDVLLGLRWEYERIDIEAIRQNADWLDRTGIDNSQTNEKYINKWSPRFAMRWDIGNRGIWIVRGGWGLYHNLVDPGAFAEVITQDGRQFGRRGLGDLGFWPEDPGLGAAPIIGQQLSMLGPEFQGPRTSRVNLGLSRLFDDRTAVILHGVYRYTDHLVRRNDLNLVQSPTTVDQYGRPVYGQLVQQGSLLQVEPGTNRRFQDFAVVSALNADGVSNYWAGTLAFERHLGEQLEAIASYTFSWTEDNWLSGMGGGPPVELTPFPDSLNRRDWTKGTSDFDRPHTLVLAAQYKFPLGVATSRVAAFYRFSSGVPFTPGFRDAVDVNGDGSGRNDPAYIDGALDGMPGLISAWGCLSEQIGRYASRNSCRGPSLHRLDLRLAVGLYTVHGHPLELVVDVLNVLDAETNVLDKALLLIDGGGTVQTNPDGTITIPFQVNPNFGKPLIYNQQGRALRFGLRMGI